MKSKGIMIEFNYNTQGDEIILTLKTGITEIGTFHKMVAVIYSLDWDIVSGDIRTLEESGKKISFDILRLKKDEKKITHITSELGLLMDTVFNSKGTISEIVNSLDIKRVDSKKFFKNRCELIFEDDPVKNYTICYIEAENAKGLLYYVTKVLMEYNIDILNAKIETDPNRQVAMDTFYVTDQNGQMFGNLPVAKEIREQILKPL
jgi:UTP:GlnB (protein PII) uridylyltransferase